MDYLKLAKMLSVLGKIYRMGHISEAEYNEVKKKLLKEYNIYWFVHSLIIWFCIKVKPEVNDTYLLLAFTNKEGEIIWQRYRF